LLETKLNNYLDIRFPIKGQKLEMEKLID
jgi:hypothetical protein